MELITITLKDKYDWCNGSLMYDGKNLLRHCFNFGLAEILGLSSQS